MNGIIALMREAPESTFARLPGEHTARRWPSASREALPHQVQDLPVSPSWLQQPPELALLWQVEACASREPLTVCRPADGL